MNIFLRYGSHSEKDYFSKMLLFFDGIIFNSNLIEATPAATASLINKFCGNSSTNYIIDPMTYSFGEYIKPETGEIISNLEWLESKGKKGKGQIKSSYKKLAQKLGPKFSDSIQNRSAIKLQDLMNSDMRKSVCEYTIKYQNQRIKDIFREDEEFAFLADDLPDPYLIYSPYFYIDKDRMSDWLEVYRKICEDSLEYTDRLYLKLCFDFELLKSKDFISGVSQLPQDGLKGICLWASKFNERKVEEVYLQGFKSLVETIKNKNINVFNRHGSYFSYLLSKFGLTEVSHGVGYGSYKDVMPVIGGGSPTINFYYPNLHNKFGVPKIERAFPDIGVSNAKDFFEKICDCAICKGVIQNNLNNFDEFAKTHFATEESTRPSQTPMAAKKARFHYLLAKAKEKRLVQSKDLSDLLQSLDAAIPISNLPIFETEAKYIERWKNVLQLK